MFTKTFVKFCNTWELDIPRIETSLLRGMKPGKILRREILLARPEYNECAWKSWIDTSIQDGLHALKADQYAKEVNFAYSYDKILEVYLDKNCPSCMSDPCAAEIAAQFYAANGFVIAYRHDGDKITARTVTFGKEFTDFYGPEAKKLSAGLEELDYTAAEGSSLPYWSDFEIPYLNGRFYIPYLDCASGCFIPYAGRHDTKHNRWTCLYVPYSMDYEELIDPEEMESFVKLKESIEQGDYLDQFLTGMPHGEACKHQGALHYLEKIAEPKNPTFWSQTRIAGRLFWRHHWWEQNVGWDFEIVFMDDYGNAVDRVYEYGVKEKRTNIILGMHGQF